MNRPYTLLDHLLGLHPGHFFPGVSQQILEDEIVGRAWLRYWPLDQVVLF